MYTLFFDTDCDITPAIAKEYGAKLIQCHMKLMAKK